MTAPAKAAPMREDVTQIDREAYAEFAGHIGRLTTRDAESVRAGEWDDTSDVQWFAAYRRRLAHTARPDARDEDVDVLRLFVGAAYPVSTQIDPRGYRWCEAYLDQALAAMREGADPISAPANGEPDPEWAAIKRAIDQFVGRVPSIGKHRALNNAHLAAQVERLDATGDKEAADTIVWQCWWRALDRERERFLLADAEEKLAAAASVPGAA